MHNWCVWSKRFIARWISPYILLKFHELINKYARIIIIMKTYEDIKHLHFALWLNANKILLMYFFVSSSIYFSFSFFFHIHFLYLQGIDMINAYAYGIPNRWQLLTQVNETKVTLYQTIHIQNHILCAYADSALLKLRKTKRV